MNISETEKEIKLDGYRRNIETRRSKNVGSTPNNQMFETAESLETQYQKKQAKEKKRSNMGNPEVHPLTISDDVDLHYISVEKRIRKIKADISLSSPEPSEKKIDSLVKELNETYACFYAFLQVEPKGEGNSVDVDSTMKRRTLLILTKRIGLLTAK